MAQGKAQLKFERNPCIKFRDNCDTDGRQTMDKLQFHELELKTIVTMHAVLDWQQSDWFNNGFIDCISSKIITVAKQSEVVLDFNRLVF